MIVGRKRAGRPLALAAAALLVASATATWALDRAPGQGSAAGSGIEISTLSETQIDNLALLGRIWGFLKYHHPRVAAGKLDWDQELFRALPAVLEAADRDAGNGALRHWVRELGAPEDCGPAAPRARRCTAAPKNAYLLPDLDWLDDAERLGPELSALLREVHRRRAAGQS